MGIMFVFHFVYLLDDSFILYEWAYTKSIRELRLGVGRLFLRSPLLSSCFFGMGRDMDSVEAFQNTLPTGKWNFLRGCLPATFCSKASNPFITFSFCWSSS